MARVALAFALSALAAGCGGRAEDPHLVRANDNREPAGRLNTGVLTIQLDVVRAEWRPESDRGPSLMVEAFAETGKAPRIPGPLLRVRTGTTIAATVRNTLPDSTVTVFGLTTRRAPGATGLGSAARDSLVIRPGDSVLVRFAAGRRRRGGNTGSPWDTTSQDRRGRSG